jgi:hypothetical protein
MQTIDEVVNQIEGKAALVSQKPETQAAPTRYGSMAAADYHRQGDIFIRRIGDVPSGAIKQDKPIRQLAPGTNQGSRHLLDSLSGITLYTVCNPSVLDGPIIVSDRQFTVEHPEHGHCTVPAGTYAINYQREYAEELRRVAD